MKPLYLYLSLILAVPVTGFAQKTVKVPGVCNMYLDQAKVVDVTLEKALQWVELVPPTVQCDDGKVYPLEEFQVSFLTVKPFMNQEFGLAERGFPIRAREAIKNGKPGDAIVLKQVVYLDTAGVRKPLPVISIKLK